MQTNFSKCLKLVLVSEGGYVNNPKDPGGATNKGITQAVYDAYRSGQGEKTQSVKLIKTAEMEEIYRQQFWAHINGDRLPDGVDYAVFDYAVNSGVGRAVKDFQRVLGASVDGVMGKLTLEAACNAPAGMLIEKLCDRRLSFLHSLKTWTTFRRGWEARVETVRSTAMAMAMGNAVKTAPPKPPAVAKEAAVKAPEAAQAVIKTVSGAGAALGGAGAAGNVVMKGVDQVQPHIDDTPWGRIALAVFLILLVVGIGLVIYDKVIKVREVRQ